LLPASGCAAGLRLYGPETPVRQEVCGIEF